MKITLVYNPEAGYEEPSRIKIMNILKEHGAEVKYISSKDENLESELLSNLGEQVMVAGGDGTVHKIARLLIHKSVPITIVPIGTANNVAMSLNDERLSLDSAYWLKGDLRHVDVGEVEINGQKRIFFESLGLGTLATMMQQDEITKKIGKPNFENRHHKLMYLYQFMLKILPTLSAEEYHITVDEKNYDGRYLWVEVINMKYFGPHLKAAPEADFGDGALDILLIREEERPLLEQYFSSLLAGDETAPSFKVVRGKKILIQTIADPLHVDDVILTKEKDLDSAPQFRLSIQAKQNALSLVKYPLILS